MDANILNLGWVTIINATVVYPILMSICGYMFYKHHQKPYFTQRNLALSFSNIIILSVGLYLTILPGSLFNMDLIHIHWQTFFMMAIAIAVLITLIFSIWVFDLLLKIRHAQESKNWRSLLNPEHKETNWIIRCYPTLSNSKYQLMACALIFAIFESMTTAIFISTNEDLLWTMRPAIVLGFTLLIFNIVCLAKIGRFADFWYIRFEVWTYTIVLLMAGTCVIITLFGGFKELNLGERMMIAYYVCTIVAIMYPCIVLIFPIFINERRNKLLNITKYMEPRSSRPLYQLIQRNKGYEALMTQMEKEFAVENLLFLTEMIQFRDYLIENSLYLNDMNQIFQGQNVSLPNKVPLSPIIESVHNNNGDDMTSHVYNIFAFCLKSILRITRVWKSIYHMLFIQHW